MSGVCRRETETRCIRYEMLYRQCQKYVRERSEVYEEPLEMDTDLTLGRILGAMQKTGMRKIQ